jgi:uncharacterized protein
MDNPCLSCGACCACFRVSFYWGEADQDGSVPPELTEDVDSFRRCMKGTNQKSIWCVALQGEIGKAVSCSIYERRSSTCREFGIHWDRGVIHIDPQDIERCTQARAAWGLPPVQIEPLTPDIDVPPISDNFAA